MDGNRKQDSFRRVAELFQQALEHSLEERGSFVRASAHGDQELQREVLALLKAHEGGSSLPDLPTRTAAAERERNAPERIGRYHILEKIGEGGMGSVYVAEQREPMRRRVALKLLKPGMESSDVIARFEAERQALALMEHANIAKVFDGGVTDEGRPYFAMEYVPGEPLTTYCDRRRLALRDRLELYVKVCDAIQHAHQKGIIHRDLKPSNILVTPGDGVASPKVIDFGIAKAVGVRLTDETLFTAHGLLIGTPEYMSPEQAEAGPLDIDTRSDVYSLGVVLYELLVGRLPFDRQSLREAGISESLRVLREEEPPRPSTRLNSLADAERRTVLRDRQCSELQIGRELGRDLDWVVLRALDKDRNRRYPSASELAADIQRYLRDEPVLAGPPSVTYRVHKFARRHRLGVAGSALLALVLVGSSVALSLQARRLKLALDQARHQTDRAETVSGLLVDAFGEADPTHRTVDHEVTAREVLERGADILDDRDLEPDVRVALSNSMASAFLGLNMIDKADELSDGALEAAQEAGGESLSSALMLKSRVLRSRSKHDQAGEYSRRAVEHSDSKALDPRVRIRARCALGKDLLASGQYADAESVLIEAEELAATVPGIDGMLLADLLLARAEVSIQLSNYQESIELGKRALDRMTTLSKNPLHWIQARRVIAISLYELGQLDEAIEWDGESYGIAVERLGETHSTTRLLRDNLARRLDLSGNGRQALELFEKSVAISRQLEPVGRRICSELNNLGLAQQGLDRLGDAEATFREALEKQVAVVGRDHPNPGYHMMNLARVLHDAGRFDEAETHYQGALELWQRLLPADHTLMGNAKIWYGALMVETDRAREGLPLIESGVAIRERDRGDEDWQTAEARSWLGAALAEVGESEQAEPLLVQAYPVILEQRGTAWRRTRWSLRRVLAFYDLIGDRAKFERYATEYRQRYGVFESADPARRWSSH